MENELERVLEDYKSELTRNIKVEMATKHIFDLLQVIAKSFAEICEEVDTDTEQTRVQLSVTADGSYSTIFACQTGEDGHIYRDAESFIDCSMNNGAMTDWRKFKSECN